MEPFLLNRRVQRDRLTGMLSHIGVISSHQPIETSAGGLDGARSRYGRRRGPLGFVRLILSFTAVVVALGLTVPAARAATNFQSKAVGADQVPSAVLTTHQKRYGRARTSWRRNSWNNSRGVAVTVFVGWFRHDKKAHRAAYRPKGDGYLTIRYLGGRRGVPEAIRKKVEAAHSGLRISAAQRYDAFARNMTAFRVVLRKGSTKVVTWVDKQGDPISKDNLPDAIEELGS